jgi:diadenosine tetraphosphatase ApaH/serine/threonine PP2A family protein phosphatase
VLAVLYDIHGNLPALEAVLDDARRAGAGRYLLGGDYALAGAWPRETVERLEGLPEATWIRGNVDRWLVDRSDAPEPAHGAIDAARELLGDELADRLAALPEQAVLDEVRYCHASPPSDMRPFFPEPGDDEEELLAGVEEKRVVAGHIHVQFARERVLNPGSVGMPWDGDHRAAYALRDDDGSFDLRRVEYDWEASAAAIRDRLGAAGELPARRLEAARFDV